MAIIGNIPYFQTNPNDLSLFKVSVDALQDRTAFDRVKTLLWCLSLSTAGIRNQTWATNGFANQDGVGDVYPDQDVLGACIGIMIIVKIEMRKKTRSKYRLAFMEIAHEKHVTFNPRLHFDHVRARNNNFTEHICSASVQFCHVFGGKQEPTRNDAHR